MNHLRRATSDLPVASNMLLTHPSCFGIEITFVTLADMLRLPSQRWTVTG